MTADNPYQPSKGWRGTLRNGERCVFWRGETVCGVFVFTGFRLYDGCRLPEMWQTDGAWREDKRQHPLDLTGVGSV